MCIMAVACSLNTGFDMPAGACHYAASFDKLLLQKLLEYMPRSQSRIEDNHTMHTNACLADVGMLDELQGKLRSTAQ